MKNDQMSNIVECPGIVKCATLCGTCGTNSLCATQSVAQLKFGRETYLGI